MSKTIHKMIISDICAGYLSDESLLAEYKALYTLRTDNNSKAAEILEQKIPEPDIRRWSKYSWALGKRHQLIGAEMSLRHMKNSSEECIAIADPKGLDQWPEAYIVEPLKQFQILGEVYGDRVLGRISLPHNPQQLWRQHKYSVLARDNNLYKKIGKHVAQMKAGDDRSALAKLLTETLRVRPSDGGVRNTLQHMWGYVSDYSDFEKHTINSCSLTVLLHEIQRCTFATQETYLYNSTALSELNAWL